MLFCYISLLLYFFVATLLNCYIVKYFLLLQDFYYARTFMALDQHFYTGALFYCYFASFLHCCIATLLHCCIFTLLDCYIAVSLHSVIVTLLHYFISILLYFFIALFLHCYIAKYFLLLQDFHYARTFLALDQHFSTGAL